MSRHLLAFLFSELKTLRLICKRKGCGGVVEIPLANIKRESFETPRCPLCDERFIVAEPAHNPILEIIRAWQRMDAHKSVCDIEFVIPADN